MANNKDDEIVGLLPPKKSLACFLLVTVLLLAGTALSGNTVLQEYFSVSPKWLMGSLSVITIIFCLVNFQVSRGSFACTKVLKYYALFLAIICIPSFFIVDKPDYFKLSLGNISISLFAFYLISGKTYKKLVQYQNDFFSDIKAARETAEKILNESLKQKKKRS